MTASTFYGHFNPKEAGGGQSGDGTSSIEVEDGSKFINIIGNEVYNSSRSIFPHTHSDYEALHDINITGNMLTAGYGRDQGDNGGAKIDVVAASDSVGIQENILVTSNTLDGGNINFAYSTGVISNNIFKNHIMTSDVGLIVINTGSEAILTGNDVKDSLSRGIYAAGKINASVNKIHDNADDGIELTETADYSVLSINDIYDNGSGDYSYGIRVNGADNVQIQGGGVYDTGGAVQDVGIRIDTAAANAVINGVSVYDNDDLDLWIQPTDVSILNSSNPTYIFPVSSDTGGATVFALPYAGTSRILDTGQSVSALLADAHRIGQLVHITNQSASANFSSAVRVTSHVNPDIVVEDAEDVWTQDDGNTTTGVDNALYKEQSGSVTFGITAASAVGLQAHETISSIDLSGVTTVGLWMHNSGALSSGELNLVLDENGDCSSPSETLALPAWTTQLNKWQYKTLTLVSAAADRDAITCVGFTMGTDDAQTLTIKFDDIIGIKSACIFDQTNPDWYLRWNGGVWEDEYVGCSRN